jgi:AcrR family transcriptional regulator
MTPAGEPKWRRRKEERPGEIIAAAMAVFAEKGFAAARLDDIAKRAGVSKGALYLYFETKEDLFHAVVTDAVAPRIQGVIAMVEAYEGPFADLISAALPRMAEIATTAPIGGVAKMVLGESRNFPDLARFWHDDLVNPAVSMMAGAIARAQAKGEVKAGDPKLYAFSLIGAMLLGILWRETFTPVGAPDVDMPALARQHVSTVLGGMLTEARS